MLRCIVFWSIGDETLAIRSGGLRWLAAVLGVSVTDCRRTPNLGRSVANIPRQTVQSLAQVGVSRGTG